MLHGGLRQEKREHLLLGDAPLDVTEPLRLLERRVQLLRRHAAPLGQLLDPAVELRLGRLQPLLLHNVIEHQVAAHLRLGHWAELRGELAHAVFRDPVRLGEHPQRALHQGLGSDHAVRRHNLLDQVGPHLGVRLALGVPLEILADRVLQRVERIEVPDLDSLDALKHAIREDLERDAEREADAKVRADLIEQIVAANRVVAPKPLVERALWVFAQAYGIPEDRMSQFAAEFRPVAEAQVRRDLVLDYVVEQQGLQATEAELDRRIQELAERLGMPAEQLYASLEKAKRLRDVERSITEEKVFAFLLSQSTVEHV